MLIARPSLYDSMKGLEHGEHVVDDLLGFARVMVCGSLMATGGEA
jgi:hypothetical protein